VHARKVQSLLLRAMAERSVFAFDREYTFPHMTLFADRNKVEKEETFELASAARDRFMFELNMATPEDTEVRRAPVFDPTFHDADTLLSLVTPAVLPWQELNTIAANIQASVHASEAIERYALNIWQATETPRRYGIELDDVDMDNLIIAGASPRGMSMLLRAARVVAWLAGREYVEPEDLHGVMTPALGHRVFFTPVYELRRTELAQALTQQIVERIAAP
jgi:MoxR-like ATPase